METRTGSLLQVAGRGGGGGHGGVFLEAEEGLAESGEAESPGLLGDARQEWDGWAVSQGLMWTLLKKTQSLKEAP